ncbi:MAG: hypothetical protein ACLP05_04000 [Candidatus Kryptoniota bacterium]
MAENRLTIIFKRAQDYRIYPAGLIFGGPTPDGENILMNVCVDHAAIPNYTQHPIVQGKVNINEVVDQAVAGEIEREVLCGISISITQARRLVDWLNNNIDQIEKGKGHE